MLLATLALALATGDVVGELLRFPAPPPPPDPGWPPKCCECRSKPGDVPKFAKPLASHDRAKRTRAANELAGILKYCTLPEATALLSPWIGDPSWAEETRKGARMIVVEHAGWDNVSEAVPGLLRAVEYDPSPDIRAAAARALAQIGDPRGNDAMRRALRRDGHNSSIMIALIERHGFTDDELQHALEVYLTGDPESSEALLGAIVAHGDRRRELAPMIVKTIDDQRANAQVIVDAVMRHDDLCKYAAGELALLRSRGGVRAGIAAAILGDPADVQKILAGDDAEAIRALRAASRFRMPR